MGSWTMLSDQLGVSVVICSHNGAERLPHTLAYLLAQRVPCGVKWEVLLVDNASTDDTSEVARRCWTNGDRVPLRIIREERLGVGYARERGLLEAQLDIVSFVDDDNWIAADWVGVVSEVMSANLEIGGLGGLIYPKCEAKPPHWFEQFRTRYATLTEDELPVARTMPGLCSAGLSIRKSAWEMLVGAGFSPFVIGARGGQLSRGEDSELTFALNLSGWQLQIEPRLRMLHFMPASRLTWLYLRRLVRESSASTVALDGYYFVQYGRAGFKGRLREYWLWHLGAALLQIVTSSSATLVHFRDRQEGDAETLRMDALFGRLIGLLRLRGKYGAIRREVREARWRKRQSLNVE